MCEQAPILCSNASFKLVSHSMVNSHFPSDLYWFCTLLSMHTYTQVEIAMQAASKVGIKGNSLLSGLFLCQQRLHPKLWGSCLNLQFYRNFDCEGYSSSRASCWIFGMGCGIILILTLKEAVQINVYMFTVYADIWPIHALDAVWSCPLLKWCNFGALCQVPWSIWYSTSWWGENRYPTAYL